MAKLVTKLGKDVAVGDVLLGEQTPNRGDFMYANHDGFIIDKIVIVRADNSQVLYRSLSPKRTGTFQIPHGTVYFVEDKS